MALSVKQLIASVPNEPDIKNAKYVRVKNHKKHGHMRWTFETRTKIPGQDVRAHRIEITNLDDKNSLYKTNAIFVSCDCARFKFMWEFVLAMVGASTIKYSNGKAPVDTNPKMKIGGCKHIFRCLSYLMKNKLI